MFANVAAKMLFRQDQIGIADPIPKMVKQPKNTEFQVKFGKTRQLPLMNT